MPFGSEKLRVKSEEIKWRTDGSERDQKVYTTKSGGFWMNGNFGTDGLVYADRTPLPNYYELQHNYARAFVGILGCGSLAANLSITNRYDFIDLKDNVTFNWALTLDRDTVEKGAFSPDCPPHTTVPYRLPLPMIPNEVISNSLYVLNFSLTDADGHTFLQQSIVLNKPDITWTGHGSGEVMTQEKCIRTGRKPTMAERITQKGRLPQRYLLPIDNNQVKADIQSRSIDGGEEIAFTLTPDTADVFRSELGLAYLLKPEIDRVQWLGYGPFASYPGRHQANRYGLWAKHKDDLYFEGNHGGVDAAFFSDKEGNGVLVVGDSLNLNFEQTDRGIVMTVNAAVSGQGPKFAKTAFNGWKPEHGPVGAMFRFYYIKGDVMPQVVKRVFAPASEVPAPFKPFLTQYDTYLLKYDSILMK
jgi:beta-galactosidase